MSCTPSYVKCERWRPAERTERASRTVIFIFISSWVMTLGMGASKACFWVVELGPCGLILLTFCWKRARWLPLGAGGSPRVRGPSGSTSPSRLRQLGHGDGSFPHLGFLPENPENATSVLSHLFHNRVVPRTNSETRSKTSKKRTTKNKLLVLSCRAPASMRGFGGGWPL